MPFDSGSLSFRIFELPDEMKDTCLEGFARCSAPPIETLSSEAIQGWVSSQHLLDRDLREDNAFIAGYLVLALMKAEWKIPEGLMRAYCRMEEEVERRARRIQFLSRKGKSEVKKRVVEQLQPGMPPTLTGMAMAFDFSTQVLYASAMSDTQLDAFSLAFREATGISPLPVTPQHAAMRRKRINFRDLEPTVFSPDPGVQYATDSLGLDFFTWLWHFWETSGGNFEVPGSERPFGVMLEGPLTFFMEGDGAHETVLKKGMPLVAVEAKAALVGGKKLRKGKITMARGEEMWSVNFDAEEFTFRGVKLPKGDGDDPATRFQERMLSLQTLTEAIWALFDIFLDDRGDRDRWSRKVADMQQWISSRSAQT